ncbi:DNA polymerase I [Bernardetia litoralis DSM 6794]|uniref:DNA polymerase I n=1 Tax=Bernardetia litoralis (strain ATCC 23117 / DSM 6794 / NBRC 15988 / NCIMB 1366 / Fx l1 / Sio-4) TaxID=880071 RepID=I4AQ61_BERLS|nr:DNA polymerase I [Bernardetia litoralis]AFM06096.1 DNA polymerase I [Bernardetia litoralis DSM 6794]
MLSTPNAPKKLFLLDAMALIYRAHFAFSKNPRVTSTGIDTGAILGFTNAIWDVLQNEKPTHIGIAFDTSKPTFRHEQFEAYKAHREKQPEAITLSKPFINRLLEGLNIPILKMDGFEADDIVGTLAKKAAREGFEVYMVTIDKDYAQLVEEKIFFYKVAYAGRNPAAIWGIKEVCERWDLKNPMQLTDILGLQGDAADNIPGIPGIGEKTAIKLLKLYDSVEGIIENVDKLKGKQKENVTNFAAQGILSKELATIKIDVPIEFDAKALEYDDVKNITSKNKETLSTLFDELEFRTLKRKILNEESTKSFSPKAKIGSSSLSKTISENKKATTDQMDLFGSPISNQKPTEKEKAALAKLSNTLGGKEFEKLGNTVNAIFEDVETSQSTENLQPKLDTLFTIKHDYHLIDTKSKREHLLEFLLLQDEICIDTETDNLNVMEANIVGFSVAYKEFEAFYIPVLGSEEEQKNILNEFRSVLENPKILKIGQNIKYDYQIFYKYGIELKGQFFDTMLAHYVLEPELRHNMDYLAQTILDYQTISYSEIVGTGKKIKTMADFEPKEILNYAAEDADITLRLKNKLSFELEKEENKGLKSVFYDIEIPLVSVLAKIEMNGMNIDTKALAEFSIELGKDVEVVEKEIYQIAGEEFNIASPKQLGEILFDEEKLNLSPKPKLTAKSKQYKTDESILVKLASKYPIAAKIVDYRQLQKLKSTYVDALPLLLSSKDNKVHTSFNQAVTSTGRLSSTNPNLQNIPIRTERGREVRKAFIPSDENHVLLAVDYSQIELRLMASFAEDPTMIEAFKNNRDIHTATAAKIFKVTIEDVTPEMRRSAKTANFGIIYGVSAMGLGQRLNIKTTEAKKLIDSYFAEFSSIKNYMDKIINEARDNESVQTLLGRKRPLRDINSRNMTQRGFAERNAVNMPIQGTAADIIKLAMVKVQEYLEENNLKTTMVLQVHDELVFDVPKAELEIVKPKIMEIMSKTYQIDVPLDVEAGIGQNWLEAH